MKLFLVASILIFYANISYAQSSINTDVNRLINGLTKPATETTKSSKKLTSQKIVKIQFEGLDQVDEQTVRDEITVTEGSEFNDFILRKIKQEIKSMGLFRQVNTSVKSRKDGLLLIVKVSEFPIVKTIDFSGNKNVSSNELLKVIESKINKGFSLSKMRSDIDAIDSLYQSKGFFQSKVYNVVRPSKKNKFVLTFNIQEGTLETVVVTGNSKTRDYVILRELETKPGDILNQMQIKEDLRRVFNLNYFANLEPQFMPGTKSGKYKLRLKITERPTSGSFSFGGGYSPVSGFSLFTDLYWDNLFGTGQLIMLRGQFGKATTYQFKYFNPWMWDERRSFMLKTWSTKGAIDYFNMANGNVFDRDELRSGVEVGFGVPYNYNIRTSHHFKYESVNFFGATPNDDYFYRINSYIFSASLDTRDVAFNPSKGYYHDLSIENGFKFSHDSLEFSRVNMNFRAFIPTYEKQTVAAKLTLGYARYNEPNASIYSTEFYYIGGSSTVRGYEDQFPFAYGNKQILANIEYRFLFNDSFQAVLFIDAGFAPNIFELDREIIRYNQSFTKLSNYKVGKGIGLRFLIPGLGPLRLDAGMDDLSVMRIHFNIGHSF